MCGRYTLRASGTEVAQHFQLREVPQLAPRYNIAPAQDVLAIRQRNGERFASQLRWGLIPGWAKDTRIGARMINARAETIAEKPAFRNAFRRRRCLIVADGFYEWQAADSKTKQPYLFSLQPETDRLFAFAGLWESWQDADGQPIESCTIITTTANELVHAVHDRMPVILDPEHYERWLDPHLDQAGPLQDLLQPYPSTAMRSYAVTTRVNQVRNDDPGCVEALEL